MLKIAKVISNCNECPNCKKFNSDRDNFTRAFVCYVSADDQDKSPAPFLLDYTESGGSHELVIPNNCPLEDYKAPE